jgi:lipoate---protein ligase
VLYGLDTEKMFSLLKVGAEKISDKMIAAAEERVTSLKKLRPELTLEDLYKALFAGFTAGKKYETGEWTLAELARAHELADSRYRTAEWNEMR